MSNYRGEYRGLYCSLFDDPDFLTLGPVARHVLLTLRLCPEAKAAAIFRWYPETLLRQTGYRRAVLDRALAELADPLDWTPDPPPTEPPRRRSPTGGPAAAPQAGRASALGGPSERAPWVIYDRLVLWVRNGLRYDPNLRLADEKHRKSVERSLGNLPQSDVVLKFCDYYRLPRPFRDPIETLGRGRPPNPNPRTSTKTSPNPKGGGVRGGGAIVATEATGSEPSRSRDKVGDGPVAPPTRSSAEVDLAAIRDEQRRRKGYDAGPTRVAELLEAAGTHGDGGRRSRERGGP